MEVCKEEKWKLSEVSFYFAVNTCADVLQEDTVLVPCAGGHFCVSRCVLLHDLYASSNMAHLPQDCEVLRGGGVRAIHRPVLHQPHHARQRHSELRHRGWPQSAAAASAATWACVAEQERHGALLGGQRRGGDRLVRRLRVGAARAPETRKTHTTC